MNYSNNFTYSGSSGTKLEVTVNTTATSVTNNTTTERVRVKFIHTTSSYDNTSRTATLTFNGKTRTKAFSYGGATTITLWDFTQIVAHNGDGTKTANLKITDDRGNMPYTGTVSVNVNLALDTIPRYAKITSLTNTSIDLNRAVFSFSTDVACDSWRYKIGSGSWNNFSSSSTFTVMGLTPNTSYTITLGVRRTSSGLWTEKAINVKTKALPTITANAGTYIGDKVTYTVNNSIGTIVVGIHAKGSHLVNISGGSHTFTTAQINTLYSRIPNNQNIDLDFILVVTQNGTTYYTPKVSKNVKVKDVNPTFNSFSFKDINETTTALTGDNQVMIKSNSHLEVTIPPATALKSARMVRYLITTGNNSKELSHTGNNLKHTFTNITVNNVKVIAYDSRGLSTEKSYTFVLKDYSAPTIQSADITRVDGIGTTGNLSISGKFMPTDFGAIQNRITKAEYRKSGGNWTDITTTVADNVNGTFKESISPGIAGFEFGVEYNVDIRITDRLRSVTTSVVVNSGKIFTSYDKSNHRIGIGTTPWAGSEGVYIDTLYTNNFSNPKDIEQDGRLNKLEANNPIVLGSTENLNDLKTNKVYLQTLNVNVKANLNYPGDYPDVEAGFLEVSTADKFVRQRYTSYNKQDVFLRSYYNGTWRAWKKMTTNREEIPYTINRDRVTNVVATKEGRIAYITFDYDPSTSSTGWGKFDLAVLTMGTGYEPFVKAVGSAYPASSSDLQYNVTPYIVSSGSIGVVSEASSNTSSGKWTCTITYLIKE